MWELYWRMPKPRMQPWKELKNWKKTFPMLVPRFVTFVSEVVQSPLCAGASLLPILEVEAQAQWGYSLWGEGHLEKALGLLCFRIGGMIRYLANEGIPEFSGR